MAQLDISAVARGRALAHSGAGRSIRLAARISLGELARAIGASQPAISRWERGVCLPSPEYAARYAAELDELLRSTK